jgi:hypothetical protein
VRVVASSSRGLHHAIRGLALDPSGLAVVQCGVVGTEEVACESLCRAFLETQALRSDEDAREEAGKIVGHRRQGGLIEIIEVEVGETIVTLVTPEVLQVEIAGDPGQWCPVEYRLSLPVLVEQVAGPAHERECILAHCLVLQRQPLGLATRVVSLNALYDRRCRHRSCPFRRSRHLVSAKPCNELSPGSVLLGARSSRVAMVQQSITAAVTTGS